MHRRDDGGTALSLRAAVAVVAGGTGRLGTPITRALLRAGARVVVPSRAPERLARLRAAVADVAADRLIGLVADLGTTAGAEHVRARALSESGRVDVVAAALGSWPSTDAAVPHEFARPALDDVLTAHFVAGGALFAALAAYGRGSYTIVSTDAVGAETGPLLLARMFMREAAATSVRVNAVVVSALQRPGDVRTPLRDVGGRRVQAGLIPADVGTFVAALAAPATETRAEVFRLAGRPAFRGALARVLGPRARPWPARARGAAVLDGPIPPT